MARPIKNGLDYFPFDVDFFSNKKIKRLRARYGNDGVTVYIYIICEMYRKGYCVEYDEDFILDISDELNISENSTKQIVGYLLSRSLITEIKLAESVKVLTAESVQRRYQEAKANSRRDIYVTAEFWVLEKEETLSFIKVRPFSDFNRKNGSFYRKNPSFYRKNSTKESKVKKSKVKERKEGETAAPSPHSPEKQFGDHGKVLLSENDYNSLVSDFGEVTVREYIRRADVYAYKHSRTYTDCNAIIRKWITEDGACKSERKETSFDLEEYKELVNTFEE